MLDRVRGAALIVLLVAGTASADEPKWGVEAELGGSADSEVAASGHAGGTLWLGADPYGTRQLHLAASIDVERVPWLSAARELSASPYSVAQASFGSPCWFDPEEEWYGDYFTFPIDLHYGALIQDGATRRFAGGAGTAMRACWDHGDDDPTCVGWFGGRAGDVRDDARSYGSVAIYLVPVEGVRLGPVRLDAKLGGGSATRTLLEPTSANPELLVSSFHWDVALRGRAGDVDLALRSGREPYASTDGALSFEDRVEASASAGDATRFTASAFVARTRWWMSAEAAPEIADTAGGELAIASRVAGFDVVARAAVGRAFYPSLDAALPAVPSLGARVTFDVSRTFTVLGSP